MEEANSEKEQLTDPAENPNADSSAPDFRNMDPSELYMRKVNVLRKMGRMQEAVNTVLAAKEQYGDEFREYPAILNIWLEAGNRENAATALKLWGKVSGKKVLGNRYEGNRCAAIVECHLLWKNFGRAKFNYINYRDAMTRRQYEDLGILTDSVSGKTGRYLEVAASRYNIMTQDNQYDSTIILNLSDALWLNGKIDDAREMAFSALKLIDFRLQEYRRNRNIFLVRRADALYMLGREDEAEAALLAARNHPMCPNCPYGTCKDADVYRVRGLWHLGKREEALKLAAEYQKKWPDDTALIFYENLMKKTRK